MRITQHHFTAEYAEEDAEAAHQPSKGQEPKAKKPKQVQLSMISQTCELVHASTLAQINVRWNTKMPTSTYYADFADYADCVAIVIKAKRLLVFAHEKPDV